MPDDKERGLYAKYEVERLDGKDVGECIVLEFDDPNARPAIAIWAYSMEEAGYQKLADDVRRKLRKYNQRKG